MTALFGMFKLTPKQRQRCSADFASSEVSLDYGVTAPAMPAGTTPGDKCFLQLPPAEQKYWRTEYEKRTKCGTWIKVESK